VPYLNCSGVGSVAAVAAMAATLFRSKRVYYKGLGDEAAGVAMAAALFE